MTPTLNWMVANDWISPEDIRDTEGMLTDLNARLIRTAEQAKVRSVFAERADMKGSGSARGEFQDALPAEEV